MSTLIAYMTGPGAKNSGANIENCKLPIDDFCKLFTSHEGRADKDGPWIAGCVGARRDNADLQGHGRALLFDFDTITDAQWATIRTRLRVNDWCFIAYTSWSCRPGTLKLRVILFGDRDLVIGKGGVTLDAISAIKAAINRDVFDNVAAKESHKPAQFFYLPSHDGSAEAKAAAFTEHLGAKPLDLSGYLMDALQGTRAPGLGAFAGAEAEVHPAASADEIVELRKILSTGAEDVHNSVVRFVCIQRGIGWLPRTFSAISK